MNQHCGRDERPARGRPVAGERVQFAGLDGRGAKGRASTTKRKEPEKAEPMVGPDHPTSPSLLRSIITIVQDADAVKRLYSRRRA